MSTTDRRYTAPAVATTVGAETLTALAATANGSPFKPDGARALKCLLDITARSGTSPTLDVKLQGRTTIGGVAGAWNDLGSFEQLTAVAAAQRAFQVTGWDELRWVKTVGGTTPSFTGTITVRKVR